MLEINPLIIPRPAWCYDLRLIKMGGGPQSPLEPRPGIRFEAHCVGQITLPHIRPGILFEAQISLPHIMSFKSNCLT